MELIPILSTIVLVMTIATCILAVAAYFLYKARERKARKARDNGTAPAVVEMQEEPHMLVAPQGSAPVAALSQGQGAYNGDQRYLSAPSQQPADGYYGEQQRYEEQPYAYMQQPNGNVQQQQSSAAPGGFDYDDRRRDRQPERSWSNADEQMEQPEPRPFDRQPQQQSGSMFYEYTNDGFIPVDAQQQPRRQALPPAPPPVPTSSSAEAAQHYASRQQAEADGAQAFAYEQRAEAEQAQRQAAQMQQQAERRDDNRQQEEGFAWL